MKRLIIIGLFAGLFAPAGLHAQKVYNEDNKVILDMTVGAGMPANTVTGESKTYWYSSFTPSQTALGAYNDHNGSINAMVFHKLEIAPNDMNKSTGNMDGTGIVTMNWVSAFKVCKASTYDGGGWRLPTQRELQMMWIFKPALETLGVTAFKAANYWSATESNATCSWIVYFGSGQSTDPSKSFDTNRARCVREIVD